MRFRVLAALTAIAAAVPAYADEACRKAVEDTFTKQRQSKAFRSEVTNPAAGDGSKQVFEYVPPALMHRIVSVPTMAEPMESIGFGNRAWIMENSGWMEMQPHYAETHRQHLADLFGAPVSIKTDYTCLGTVKLDGADYTGYRTQPEVGDDGIALVRTIYVDPKTGLPVANIVGDEKGDKPALVHESYSYSEDIKIEVPEGAPMQSMQH